LVNAPLKIWRNGYQPLSREDAPEILDYLEGLCREIGLVRSPSFLVAPLNRTIGGLAFGRLGRYYLVLNGGLIACFYKDRPVFRSVALHELAHFRNGDIDKTYFAMASWRAFVAVALLPFSVSMFFRPANLMPVETDYLFNISIRFAALAVMVYLIYKSVLRVREVYADVRASVHEGHTGSLDRVLTTLPDSRFRRWGFLQAHPSPAERRKTLLDTSRLFRSNFWTAFGVGTVVMLAFSSIYWLFSYLSSNSGGFLGLTRGEIASLCAAFILMPLVAGFVVASIWRERFFAQVAGASSTGVSRLVLGLTLGVVFGQFLSLESVLEMETTSPVIVFFYGILWTLFLFVYLLFLVQWVKSTASAWIEATQPHPSPRLVVIAILITSLVLGFLAGPMFLVYTMGIEFARDGDLIGGIGFVFIWSFLVGASHLHMILLYICLWAFPLVSLLWRKPVSQETAPAWAFLEPGPLNSPVGLPSAGRKPHPIWLAALIGLSGGLVWCGLILFLYIMTRLFITDLPAFLNQQITLITFGLFGFAALAQVALAIAAAGVTKHLRLVNGLFSAFLAGCMMTGGLILVQLLLPGARLDLGIIWELFSQVIGMGTLLGLPVLGILSALAYWMERRVTSPVTPAPVVS
jgi:hypothetical protein